MKIDRKIHVDVNGDDVHVRIIYNNRSKKWKYDYRVDSIILQVPVDTSDEEIEKRLNMPYYKGYIKERKEFYGDSAVEIYNEWIEEYGFKLENRSIEEFKEIIEKYVRIFEKDPDFKKPKSITIKELSWGIYARCPDKERLIFDPALRYYPEKYIEYLVYHEMIHTYCLNHNSPFFRKMKEKYPNWGELHDDLMVLDYLLLKNDEII